MFRLACVEFPKWSLQCLLARHPALKSEPVAVVSDERPSGVVLEANRRALSAGVKPGLRVGAARSLCLHLRTRTLSEKQLSEANNGLLAELAAQAPKVEPSTAWPGIYWLDLGGMDSLVGDWMQWAQALQQRLGACGFYASAAVGFTKAGTLCAARVRRGHCFASLEEERGWTGRVSPRALPLHRDLQDELTKLGVKNLSVLQSLQQSEGRENLKKALAPVWRLLSEEIPIQPQWTEGPVCASLDLDFPEEHSHSLLFWSKQLLDPVFEKLFAQGQAVTSVQLALQPAHGEPTEVMVSCSQPTQRAQVIYGLLRLHLEKLQLSSPVGSLSAQTHSSPARFEQGSLFPTQKQDAKALSLSADRLRARLGVERVFYLQLRSGNLPEGQFEKLASADAAPECILKRGEPALVRRILLMPQPLPPRPKREPDGFWIRQGALCGRVTALEGPYWISGGWWQRPAERHYYFASLHTGDTCWLFCEAQRWFVHGTVE